VIDTAETSSGAVTGRAADGVVAFRGIPYGGPVDGARRFCVAEPPPPWTGVLPAFTTGPRAVQPAGNLFDTLIGDYFAGGRVGDLGLDDEHDSENCLVLNVLTPQVQAGSRPVMAYIHGGGLTSGSGVIAVAASRFVQEENVVLVSINHRLNVFGHLFLGYLDPDLQDSGNLGLLDIVLALRWIRENIAMFGGDPGNVTLFGESGGGAKISALMAMPAAEGLFHKAIIESGSFVKALPAEQAERSTEMIRKRLELPRDGAVDRLREIPAKQLLDAAMGLGFFAWPVIDGGHLSSSPFADGAPATAAGIPLLLGHCDDELTLHHTEDETLDHLTPDMLRRRVAECLELSAEETSAVVDRYETSSRSLSLRDLFLRIASDGLVAHHVDRQAELKSLQPAPVFRYVFKYRPPIDGVDYGAFHTAELPLVLRLVRYPESEELSRRLAGAWAGFARSGNPSHERLPWPRYDRAERQTMIFDLASRVAADPDGWQRELWAELSPPDFVQLLLPRH
jgi:para-nitrobenzyl esterase